MVKSFISTDPHTHNSENTWFTPKFIFDELGLFDMDVATTISRPFDTAKSHICVEEKNSLKISWSGCVWMNPPYGKEINPFMDKFLKHGNGCALVFARMGSKWMQRILSLKTKSDNISILFLRKRVAFIDKNHKQGTNAGADSCIIAMGEGIPRLQCSYLDGVII